MAKSTVNKAGNYTKPSMRKRMFQRIKAGSKGGNSGQWSARKAQMLANLLLRQVKDTYLRRLLSLYLLKNTLQLQQLNEKAAKKVNNTLNNQKRLLVKHELIDRRTNVR